MSTPDQTVNIPVVAVVIPLHNHTNFIEGCIKSVAMQDYPAKFCVVVDDNSTDDGFEHVLSLLQDKSTKDLPEGVFSGTIDGLHTIVLQNDSDIHGPSIARNIGMKVVWESCHMFGVLDADDEYLPNKLSKSVKVLIEDPKMIGLVYSDVILYDVETDTSVHEFRRPFDRERLEQENIISNAPLINKLALHEVGIYDNTLRTCEDWDLWLRITEKFVAIHIPEPLQMYRITGFNATQTVDNEQWQRDWQQVQANLRERQRD